MNPHPARRSSPATRAARPVTSPDRAGTYTRRAGDGAQCSSPPLATPLGLVLGGPSPLSADAAREVDSRHKDNRASLLPRQSETLHLPSAGALNPSRIVQERRPRGAVRFVGQSNLTRWNGPVVSIYKLPPATRRGAFPGGAM
jgi:hypothetical protein